MAIDMGWFENQIDQFKSRIPQYERCAGTLCPVLDHVAKLLCPNAIVRVRVKSLHSFAEKALRKRDHHVDPVNQFTDLCGGRVITRLQAEADAVCNFLR